MEHRVSDVPRLVYLPRSNEYHHLSRVGVGKAVSCYVDLSLSAILPFHTLPPRLISSADTALLEV